MNIHACNEYVFSDILVKNGRINVAQWLYSLGNVNIHARDEYAFEYSTVRY